MAKIAKIKEVATPVILCLGAVTPTLASAQALEEVIVTAQKRAQDMQDVPFAVSALSADDLNSMGVAKTDELAKIVPNLQINSAYGDTQPNFSLRGISVGNEYNSNQASPIGVYFDEVYIGARFAHGIQLFDLERVEVLRGPQGTLYGRNTTGGAVNFISRRPELEGNNATLQVGYGNYNRLTVGAAGELTMSDTLGVRAALDYTEADGFVDNIYPGGTDTFSQDSVSGRIIARYAPADELDIQLKLYASRNEPSNVSAIQVGRLPDGTTLPDGRNPMTGYSRADDGLDFDEVNQNRGREFVTEGNGASLHIRWDVSDNWTLSSITNWDDGFFHQNLQETDGSPVQWVELDWRTDYEQYGQDLRLQYHGNEQLELMLGLYYTADEYEAHNLYELYYGLPTLPVAAQLALLDAGVTPIFVEQQFTQERESLAAYGHAVFHLTDQLSITAGLRWTDDTTEYNDGQAYAVIDPNGVYGVGPLYDTTVPGGFFPAVVDVGGGHYVDAFSGKPLPASEALPHYDPDARLADQSEDESEITGTLKIAYHFSDEVLAFAGYSRGYRAGAFNGGGYFSQHQIEYAAPEYVDAWEAGLKSRFWDGRAQLNVTGFFYDYKDQQVQQVLGTVAFLRNAGDSEVKGLEFEASAQLHERLRVDANLGWMEAEYKELVLPAPNSGGVAMDLGGNQLPSAPEWTLSTLVEWVAVQHEAGELLLRANASWRDDMWFSPFNELDGNQGLRQEDYWLLDAQLAWEGDGYRINLWGKNLADEEYLVYGLDLRAGFGFDYLMRGAPRTYGVEVQWDF